MKNKIFFGLIILNLCLCFQVFAQNDEPQFLPEEQPQEELPNKAQPATGNQSAITNAAGPAVITQAAEKNKLSLDIKGMDVIDVLKMLSARSGMNIVVGKNVAGRVTLFLKDVDLWDAFEIIILSNDLAYEKKAGIINVMTQRDYELIYGERYQDKKQAKVIQLKYAKAADLSRALNQIKSNIGRVVVDEGSNTVVLVDSPQKVADMEDFIKSTDLPLETRIFQLNYAQADKLSPKLQEAITKGVGSLKIDERTNKIAITDYPNKLEDISRIINAFDEKTTQVLIDAQIIEIKPSDKFEMGVDWNWWIEKYFDMRASLPIKAANTLFLGTTPDTTANKVGHYKAVVDILRTIGEVNILSSPRIMALNNQEAKIHVGKKDAYITSTTSQSGTGTAITSQSVNFVDTGLQLSVTPTISRDGFVTMKIKPEVSSSVPVKLLSEGQETTVPIVTSSEAETTVTIKDGVTIIIGGLNIENRTKEVRKIPVFGDIPGIGFFFRSTSDAVTKNELVILLTPHIISGESTFSDFSEVKPKEGAVAKMVNGKIVTDKISNPRQDEMLNLLSSGENNGTRYHQLVSDKIKKFAALNQPSGNKGEVSLNFSLDKSGKLSREPEVVKSSDALLIPYAMKAVKDATPFPVFPSGMDKPEENFRITLDYK